MGKTTIRPPKVINGSPGPDTITGRSGAEIIIGLAGSDRLDGGGGNDELIGGAFTLFSGADTIDERADIDTLIG